MCIDAAKSYTAVMETSMGTLTIALDAISAPRTVNNFVVLARYHYYGIQPNRYTSHIHNAPISTSGMLGDPYTH